MKLFALCFVTAVFGLASAHPGVRVGVDSQDDISPVGVCPSIDVEKPSYLADSKDQSVFYMCSEGMPIKMRCESGIFDSESTTCIGIGTYAPVGECPKVDGPYPTFLPDSERKDIYYMCSHGKPWRLSCPPGLIFDPFLNVCVNPEQ